MRQLDAPQPYDVAEPIELLWDGLKSGDDQDIWRSRLAHRYRARETWSMNPDPQLRPVKVETASQNSSVPDQAYEFDGVNGMTKKFFHVGDWIPRKNTTTPGVPDYDRSFTIESWLRLNSITENQLLIESGNAEAGMSITIGDNDNDNSFDDLRFRVAGISGNQITATVRLTDFVDPTLDFFHLQAVFYEPADDRYLEIYVNGELANRTDALVGEEKNSIQWDSKDDAGLGQIGGAEVGGNLGSGDLPFPGTGFWGQIAVLQFRNYAVTSGN